MTPIADQPTSLPESELTAVIGALAANQAGRAAYLALTSASEARWQARCQRDAQVMRPLLLSLDATTMTDDRQE